MTKFPFLSMFFFLLRTYFKISVSFKTLKRCDWLVSPFHQKSPINKFEPCTYFNMCGWNLCMAISLVLFKFCILHSSIWLFTDRETAAALVSDLESTIYWAHFVHNIILVCCFVYNLCWYIIICKTGQILEHRIRWRVLDRMIHACKHFNIFLPLLYNLCRFLYQCAMNSFSF